MAYQFKSFDGAALPLSMPEDPLFTGNVEPGVMAAAGGAFDRYGARQILPQKRQLRFRGRYDGSGSSTALQTALDALRAKIGVRGLLVRADQSATETQIYGRLLTVDGTWAVRDSSSAQLDLLFETGEATWRAKSASTATANFDAASPSVATVSIANNGTAPVYDPVIAIACTGTTITTLNLAISGLVVDLDWATGSITSGNTLTIDCGAKTVKIGSSNEFDLFSLGGSHTARDWMPLTVATHSLVVTANNGAQGSVTVTWYKRYF